MKNDKYYIGREIAGACRLQAWGSVTRAGFVDWQLWLRLLLKR
jgi:hypothetical protein